MIPIKTLPRPSTRSKNVESSPNNAPRPSNRLVVRNAAKSNSFCTTNRVLSTNTVSFSRFSGSDIHFSNIGAKTALPNDSIRLVIGLKNFSNQPNAFFAPFFSLLVIFIFCFFGFTLPTSCFSSAAASNFLRSSLLSNCSCLSSCFSLAIWTRLRSFTIKEMPLTVSPIRFVAKTALRTATTSESFVLEAPGFTNLYVLSLATACLSLLHSSFFFF